MYLIELGSCGIISAPLHEIYRIRFVVRILIRDLEKRKSKNKSFVITFPAIYHFVVSFARPSGTLKLS